MALANLASTIGGYFRWGKLPSSIESTPITFNFSITSEEDIDSLARAVVLRKEASLSELNDIQKELFRLVYWIQKKAFPRLLALEGTPQAIADYLLHRTVEIDGIVRKALTQVEAFEKTAGQDEALQHKIIQCRRLLQNKLDFIFKSIPRLSRTIVPITKDERFDISYLEDRYKDMPRYAMSIPHIYHLSLEILQPAEVKQPIGLLNKGANCWAIVLLQFFIHVPYFRKNILPQLPSPFKNSITAFIAQYQLDQIQNKSFSILNPQGLRLLLHRQFGISISLHECIDALEVLTMIIQTMPRSHILDKEPFDPGRHSYLSDTHAIVQHTKKYPFPNEGLIPAEYSEDGARISWEAALFINAPIPIRPTIQLEEIMEHVYINRYVFVDEPTRFGDIELRPEEEGIRFQTAPQQLNVGFKRFRHINGCSSKVNTHIDIPIDFTLPSQNTLDGKAAAYQLQAVVIHERNHYTICLRKTQHETDTWFLLNNEHVQEITSFKMLDLARNAYFLTYERKDFISDDDAEARIEERKSMRTPLEIPSGTCSFTTRSEIMVGLIEQFIDNPSMENFLRFPEEIRELLSHIKSIEDGKGDDSTYGYSAIMEDPRSLFEITTHYFSLHGENIIKQLWRRNVYLQRAVQGAAQEDLLLYEQWLKRIDGTGHPFYSDEQLRSLQTILTKSCKMLCGQVIWEALGKPDAKAPKSVFSELPRYLSVKDEHGQTMLEKVQLKLWEIPPKNLRG